MKTKTILGLLLAAITLSITACSNGSSSEDKGTAPQLSDVFISEITNIPENDHEWTSLEYNTTTTAFYYPKEQVENLPHYYKLCFSCTDPDLDITTIEYSYDNITFYTFYDQVEVTNTTSYKGYGIRFDTSDTNHTTQYLRLKDSKNNISNVVEFSISVSIDPNYDYSTETATK